MSDLDMGAIRSRFEAASTALAGITFGTPEMSTAVMDSLHDVPLLAVELERANRLLGDESFPTCDSYENAMQALTDLRGVLIEILRHFPQVIDPDPRDSTRSGLVPEVTLARWRRIAGVS